MSTLESENPHHHLITSRLPTWSHRASPDHWHALRTSHTPQQGLPGAEADWFANAAPDLREAVLASQARLRHAQDALARSLKALKQIVEFAEPLLTEHLKNDHGFTASLRDSELLRVHQTWHWRGGVYTNSHERQSLLQAALQNFSDDPGFGAHSALALRADSSVQPITVEGAVVVSPDVPAAAIALPSEHYQVTPLPLSPAAFAQTCRQLDLGERYQAHLRAVFEHPQHQQTIQQQAIAVHQGQLRVAADLGYLRHQLSGAATDVLDALLNGQAPQCWQASLFGIRLHDVLIIDASAAGLLLYTPGSVYPLRQFATLAALTTALGTDLRDAQTLKTFMAYVPLDRKADFTRVLAQNRGADPHLERLAVTGPVFEFLQNDHLARLKAEARLLAIPTADADEQARERRRAQWASIGLDALTLAGFFIPVVGTLMLAVTACQVLDEVYEGYQAWSIGDRDLALRHCEAAGLNLALLSGFYVAGQIVPKLFNSPLMESLDAVPLDDGQRRLWKPGLAPYRSEVALPDELAANPLGQYAQGNRHFIRIDSHLYEQRLEATHGQWRLLNPADPQAYQPRLEHNHQGAWRAEHEQPQDWTYATLVRRLGLGHHTLNDAELDMAEHISAVDKAQLQHVHLSNQPAPILLADTLDRLAAARQAALAPGEAHAQAFRRAYEGTPVTEPALERLRARYRRLSDPLARRLLNRLSPSERTAWEDEAQLPPALESDIRQLHSDLPLARAMEGMYLPALASDDSERLTFACLGRLPGWPAPLRVELRGASPEGPLLASAGAAQAQTVRTVLKTAEGYEPYLGERPAPVAQAPDVCSAILRSLSSEDRAAMGVSTDDAANLRQQLQTLARKHRNDLNQQLWSPLRDRYVHRGLRGGAPTEYPVSSLRASFISRYRRLYPRATDAEIEATLRTWRRQLNVPEIELHRLEERLGELRERLFRWAQADARRQPAVQNLIDAWRQNEVMALVDGSTIPVLNLRRLSLTTADLATLELPDDFAHVEVLNLMNNPELSELPPQFIARFAGARHLYLNHCRFDHVPTVPHPDTVKWLDLQGNRITWDARNQTALDRFAQLSVLDLSDNPLIQAPNLSRTPGLHSLFLNACSLTELPQGLEAVREPLAMDLSDNQFIRLPENLQLSPETGQLMRLESPWLSAAVHDQIAAYYEAHGVDLLVADTDYEELLDLADETQWQIWRRLPLQYRRDLRAVADTAFYADHVDQANAALWQHLQRMDSDPAFRARALARPASEVLDLMM